jgi:hypothetical protein
MAKTAGLSWRYDARLTIRDWRLVGGCRRMVKRSCKLLERIDKMVMKRRTGKMSGRSGGVTLDILCHVSVSSSSQAPDSCPRR